MLFLVPRKTRPTATTRGGPPLGAMLPGMADDKHRGALRCAAACFCLGVAGIAAAVVGWLAYLFSGNVLLALMITTVVSFSLIAVWAVLKRRIEDHWPWRSLYHVTATARFEWNVLAAEPTIPAELARIGRRILRRNPSDGRR